MPMIVTRRVPLNLIRLDRMVLALETMQSALQATGDADLLLARHQQRPRKAA